MNSQTNIVTEKVVQFKLLDIDKETVFERIGENIRILYTQNAINNALSDLYLKILSNQVYGSYGYTEDKSLIPANPIFKLSNFYINDKSLIIELNMIKPCDKYIFKLIENNELKLTFSALMEVKNGFSSKKLNKVINMKFCSFSLVSK